MKTYREGTLIFGASFEVREILLRIVGSSMDSLLKGLKGEKKN